MKLDELLNKLEVYGIGNLEVKVRLNSFDHETISEIKEIVYDNSLDCLIIDLKE